MVIRPLAAGGLLFLNAVLVAGEWSLIRLRASRFNHELPEQLRGNPVLEGLLESGGRTVKAARLGTFLCLLGYGALLFAPVSSGFSRLGLPGAAAAAAGGAVLLAVYLSAGVLAPWGVGLRHPVRTLLKTALVLRCFTFAAGPLLSLSEFFSRGILRLLRAGREEAIPDTLGFENQISGPASPVARKILRNAMRMRELGVADILLPRHQVQYFDIEDGNEENLGLAKESGHTRFPLCEGDLDKCLGLIHIKDLFRLSGDSKPLDLKAVKRDILKVHVDTPVEEALPLLLRHKAHMALAVDEFGGTAGVVTLERILEQLVGDIQDEFDAEEAFIRQVNTGEYIISGLTPLHEAGAAFGITFAGDGDVSTFGGLVTAELGRIPERRERLRLQGLDVVITEVDEKRVIAARVRVPEKPSGESGDGD